MTCTHCAVRARRKRDGEIGDQPLRQFAVDRHVEANAVLEPIIAEGSFAARTL